MREGRGFRKKQQMDGLRLMRPLGVERFFRRFEVLFERYSQYLLRMGARDSRLERKC